ncbi:N-acetylmuramoyl-L-alanine amidase [Oceanobacillus sp. Castelsardo]|uniref:N-acetylmuramoyl-L-alanine amidase n=1 Tax=Oceanobacillus sp. Castelsardo TaxID=1851204 RepID=UPI000839333A|nr:N-acetylmuramoyl-L-alanine amidase [Oceanobacillus sp. Castelsardo]
MKRIFLDPGHGGSDPGAVGHGLKEKDVVLDIALQIRSILEKGYENVKIKMSRTTDSSKSLRQRTNEANAWGAHYYISIHCNAFNGKANGYEDFIYSGLNDASQSAKYRNFMHREIANGIALNNRGKKKANFHVLRETRMPAFLSENGFIDNHSDATLMKQATWRKKIAQGHANGIAKALQLKKKTNVNQKGDSLYKVIAGSFQSKKKAIDRVSFLKELGIDAFIETITLSGVKWYRVQSGAFSNRKNAEDQLKRIEKKGIDAFILH